MPSCGASGSTNWVGSTMRVPSPGSHGSTPGLARTTSSYPRLKRRAMSESVSSWRARVICNSPTTPVDSGSKGNRCVASGDSMTGGGGSTGSTAPVRAARRYCIRRAAAPRPGLHCAGGMRRWQDLGSSSIAPPRGQVARQGSQQPRTVGQFVLVAPPRQLREMPADDLADIPYADNRALAITAARNSRRMSSQAACHSESGTRPLKPRSATISTSRSASST